MSATRMNVHIELVDEVIDPGKWQAFIDDPDVGAQGWFHGVTRRKTTNRDSQGVASTKITRTLEYEAHRPMAIRELKSIAEQAVSRYGLKSMVAIHRLGEVPIGQASIVVGCSSAHREPTFEALRWFMNRLKQDVPIWKKEYFEDGSTEWVHPTQSPPADGDIS